MHSQSEPDDPNGLRRIPLSPAPARSRPVTSNQDGPHPRLAELVRKHLATEFRRPEAPYSRQAFEALLERWDGRQPLVLDSACGTGESTAVLARRHPRALVVGVDQSEERTTRGLRKLAGTLPGNALVLRAEVTDLWALLARRGARLSHHYLLYPNPWPKAEHLMRRWHGHPRLGDLLRLGGRLELRTNWDVYAMEFAQALALLGIGATLETVAEEPALTPFERKYRQSGHRLWRLRADLPAALVPAPAPGHDHAA